MTHFDLQFSKLICFCQLNLSVGDSLSVNTEESTYEFALNFAKFAVTVTNIPVNIVVTEKGKVSQSVPVDPDLLDIQRPPVKSQIMCRILDLNDYEYECNKDPDEIAASVVAINKFALLSEPLDLKRRIAVPWTIVAYPSRNFVEKTFANLTQNEVLAYFAKLLRLDNPNMIKYWANEAGLLNYREKELNSTKDKTIVLKNRQSKLTTQIVDGANWSSNYITLKDNRSFFNFLPSQNIHTNLKNDATKGHIEASRDFYLFGKLIQKATFNILNGRVVSYDAEIGKETLDAYFSTDDNANVVSSIYLCDEQSLESKYILKAAHPFYSFENTTSIILGGAIQDSLRDINDEVDLDSIKVNQAIARVAIPVGDDFTEVSVGELHILKDGSFQI